MDDRIKIDLYVAGMEKDMQETLEKLHAKFSSQAQHEHDAPWTPEQTIRTLVYLALSDQMDREGL